ncbi:hypothetical protein BaRGS_00026225 [Batillaria attramentaria]|uniref:Large ribosomal subunit protein uL29m n=1 Tax=Batillaria attramentaria TaxID=370345 RepID=A0ABD0K5H6_9CAEN
MEFFDDKKNWGEETIKTGRPWRVDELRIKSNSDLHKLWYVLLKERNMLLTMQHEYERQSELFPNPERIEKVEDSMENIMTVVQERDEAYNLLETGTTGQPSRYYARNFLGLKYLRRPKEYHIPRFMNKTFHLTHPPANTQFSKYIRLYYEKKRLAKQSYLQRERRRKKKLLEEFPHLEGKL